MTKKTVGFRGKLDELVEGMDEADAERYFTLLSRLTSAPLEHSDLWSGIVGIHWLECQEGHSRCQVEIAPALLNPYGYASGGVLFTMIDYGMGKALSSILAENERSATIEIKLNFLTIVNSGQIVADTVIVHRGRRIVYLESRVTRDDGQLVVVATGSFYRFTVDSK